MLTDRLNSQSTNPNDFYSLILSSNGKISHTILVYIIALFYFINGFGKVVMDGDVVFTGQDEVLKVRNAIFFIIMGLNMIFIQWNRSNYQQFIKVNQQILSMDNKLSLETIRQMSFYCQLANKTITIFEVLSFLILNIIQLNIDIYDPIKLLIVLLNICFEIFSLINWFFINQFIISNCINSCVSFEIIRNLLLMVLQNTETAQQIREIRHLHLLAVKSTLRLDTLLLPSILGFYTIIVMENFMIFQDILHAKGNAFQLSTRAFISIFSLVQLTYHLVSVNLFASYCYQNVYWLSFKNYSNEAKIEINIFLRRLSPSDIGLTLGKVCLITPQFISNLVTLLLSLGLAAPGLK